jgi:hypothetical protein
MDELNNKIKQLSRYRIEYFLNNPEASKLKFLKDIKIEISRLLQVSLLFLIILSLHTFKGSSYHSRAESSNRISNG